MCLLGNIIDSGGADMFRFYMTWQAALIFLTICFGASCAVADDSFLSKHAKRVIQESRSVEASMVKAMPAKPLYIPGRSDHPKTLTPEQRKTLVATLLSAKEIDPKDRLPTCMFEPGIKFTFYSDEATIAVNSQATPTAGNLFTVMNRPTSTLSILICFNCDVWAIASTDLGPWLRPDGVFAFGDSRPERAALMELKNALFGAAFEPPVEPTATPARGPAAK
jgi:hypothetical protein